MGLVQAMGAPLKYPRPTVRTMKRITFMLELVARGQSWPSGHGSPRSKHDRDRRCATCGHADCSYIAHGHRPH